MPPATLAQVRAALRDVVPRLADLLRNVPAADPIAIGAWTATDVAAHLTHVLQLDTDALAGKQLPEVTVTAPGMADLNAQLLAEDTERTPSLLADRLASLATEFDEMAARSQEATVDWLQGVRLPPSVVAGHVLEECLIHGDDIARATGLSWPIRRDHALLAVEGGALPLITALPPAAFLNEEKAGSFRARFDLRLRGGGRTLMVFDRGSLTLETGPANNIDAHLSADPWAMMQVFIGRQEIWKPVLAGKMSAWGRRPWKLAGMLKAISPP
ncbi:maleylpyruvate isomerase N-terminal domain-containing protein [Actinomadura barringtoniae]|uniref:Maleylpyruvate isomerase N-terminal domain-containing protein n=1 Tax=Actinomadura barringtoniae TaxID=1427535 RepID=A0A939T561_9ACTN|nr:maleylpyruvate isomerase N-terminal domain-containing protein [Actinomadura barringtoniae]MBO2450248.1 maleylpyruvate isomerase N-terminal domain-containing protein [Actinomadura barringtoniae]